MPEIARAAVIWPKFFGGYWARHPQKFSLALLVRPRHLIKIKIKEISGKKNYRYKGFVVDPAKEVTDRLVSVGIGLPRKQKQK